MSASATLGHLRLVVTRRTVDHLRKVAATFCAANGFTYWTYGLVGPDTALTNDPAEAVTHYRSNRLHRGCDPVVKKILRQRRAARWHIDEFLRYGGLTVAKRQVLAPRNDIGARCGVTASSYDRVLYPFEFAITSCACDRRLSSAESRHCEVQLPVFATYFHRVAADILLSQRRPPFVDLTEQQQGCLAWVAEGKTSWEIGQILGITEPIVKDHIEKAGSKLATGNRRVMISRAIRLGPIEPPA